MSMSDIQSVLEKVRKLRTLATSSNLNEAANAAAAAERLIAEFRISEAQLSSERNISQPIIRAQSYLYETGKITQWKSDLALKLSNHYGVYVYNELGSSATGRKTSKYVMMGRESDIQILQYVFDYLMKEIVRLADICVFTYGRGVSVERNSFCLGAVDGIMNKLRAEKDAQESVATSAAMVLLNNRRAEAKAYTEGSIKLIKHKSASHGRFSSKHYQDGKQEGAKIQINPGMSGSNGPKQLG